MSTSKTRPKLILIDGHSLAYRAYFAMVNTPLSIENASGEKEMTGAVFAFANMLLKVWNQEQPTHLAVAFDVGRTFRDDLYAEYKGTREKMPDELALQIERIREVVRTLNIPVLELEGYEADDVLGTVAQQAKPHSVPVHIITGDRDLLQLVDADTRVELPSRASQPPEIYDETAVIDKFGVRPNQIVDYKALVGDTSDNIPGVKGIGEKTAVKLLAEYGTLDNLYAHLDDIKGALRQKLDDGRASADLSYKLARIVTDAPISVELKDCRTQDFDAANVLTIFRELEFRSMAKSLTAGMEVDDIPEPDVAGAAWLGFLWKIFGWRFGPLARAYVALQGVLILLNITVPVFVLVTLGDRNNV